MRLFSSIREACIQRHGRDPYLDYNAHRAGAQQRGIPFEIEFPDWWAMWEPHYSERGVSGKHMARNADSGPYKVGNVRIVSARTNAQERMKKQAFEAIAEAWEDNESASNWLEDRRDQGYF